METLVSQNPYQKLYNKNVPQIRLIDPDGDSHAQPPDALSTHRGPLSKQKSISCEVLHATPAIAMGDGQGRPNLKTPVSRQTAYVNLPKTTPKRPGSAKSYGNEGDSSGGPSPISARTTPRPSHESDCDVTDNETLEVRFREPAEYEEAAGPSEMYDVLNDYQAANDDELSLRHGSVVRLVSRKTGESEWFVGEYHGRRGLFPVTHVRLLGVEAPIIEAQDIRRNGSIGWGTFANVFRAQLRRNGNWMNVAFKQPKNMNTKGVMEDMKREAVMFHRFSHPNVVKLHGICLDTGFEGLLLELCEGNTLAQVLQKFSSVAMGAGVVVGWGAQIASAMSHLVEHGCVHRDLKADNVLVKEPVCKCILRSPASTPTGDPTKSGRCSICEGYPLRDLTLKITDFGLTREASDDRQSMAGGTEAWMAPEAYMHRQYSEASDIWSFGIVLWELLTRKVPFEGYESVFVAYSVATMGLRPPISKEWPDMLKSILQSCWQDTASERPKFTEVLKQLNELKVDLAREEREEQVGLISEIAGIIRQNQIIADPAELEQFRRMYEELSSSQPKKQAAPLVPRRTTLRRKEDKKKEKKPKFNKEDIGQPQDFTHLAHVSAEHLGPSSSRQYEIDFPRIGEPRDGSHFGTLPRKLISGASDSALQSARYTSSPNLNGVAPLGERVGGGATPLLPTSAQTPLARKNAIKKHKKPSEDFDGPDGIFQSLGISSPKPIKAKDKRTSQEGGVLSWIRDFVVRPRRSSRQESEDKDENSPNGRTPSESSENRTHLPLPTRGAFSPVTPIKSGPRPRGKSMNDEEMHSLRPHRHPNIIAPTERTAHFVKHPSSNNHSPAPPARPQFPSGMKRSPLEPRMDDEIPRTPPDTLNGIYEQHYVHDPFPFKERSHPSTSNGDLNPGYCQLINKPIVDAAGHREYGWSLDQKIPVSNSHPKAISPLDEAIPCQIGFRSACSTTSTTISSQNPNAYTQLKNYHAVVAPPGSGSASPQPVPRTSTPAQSPLLGTPPGFDAPPPPEALKKAKEEEEKKKEEARKADEAEQQNEEAGAVEQEEQEKEREADEAHESPAPIKKAPCVPPRRPSTEGRDVFRTLQFTKLPAPAPSSEKPERPATLDLAVTPGESGISTAGSSLPSSSHSLPLGQSRSTTVPVEF